MTLSLVESQSSYKWLNVVRKGRRDDILIFETVNLVNGVTHES